MINIRVITDSSTLAVAGIMLAVALVSKWLPAYIVQRINGFTAAGRNVMFGLTTAHTAVALAVVTLGFNLHMFDSRILNSTVLVILVTCALAPVLTSASAPKLKIAMLDKEDDADSILRRNRHNNTLIPVANPITAQSLAGDGSADAEYPGPPRHICSCMCAATIRRLPKPYPKTRFPRPERPALPWMWTSTLWSATTST